MAQDDAVVGCLLDASIDVREEDEVLKALQLFKAMIGALVEAIAVALMWDVNFMIFLSSLARHCLTVHSGSFLTAHERKDCDENN